MHAIVNKDHRESSWSSVEAFLDDFRTINLDLGPKSRFSAPGPTNDKDVLITSRWLDAVYFAKHLYKNGPTITEVSLD